MRTLMLRLGAPSLGLLASAFVAAASNAADQSKLDSLAIVGAGFTEASSSLCETGELRAIGFLGAAVQTWQTGAASDPDMASRAERIAATSVAVRDALGISVAFTRSFAAETQAMLDECVARLERTSKVLDEASRGIGGKDALFITAQRAAAIEEAIYRRPPSRTETAEFAGGRTTHLAGTLPAQPPPQIQSSISAFANIAQAAQDIDTILSNLASLDVSNPAVIDAMLGNAVQIGDIAQQAVSAAMAGNYFQAISAIARLFGLGHDPEAERFAVMKGYLEQMSNTLTSIAELQARILQSLEALSAGTSGDQRLTSLAPAAH
jgi:hypothetical protein